MWVHGLRRFGGGTLHKLRLDSRLVCIVGANEVGKSTLLDALELPAMAPDPETGERPAVSALDRTRGEDVGHDREIVRLRYRLSNDDRAVLADLASAADLEHVRQLEQVKYVGGRVSTEVQPVPVRDKRPRRQLATVLESAMASDNWPSPEETAGTPAADDLVEALLEELQSNQRHLSLPARGRLGEIADWLDGRELLPKLASELRGVQEVEGRSHPADEAVEALEPLIPRFVRFDEDERNIRDEYDLEAALADPPKPLINLANLAALDLGLLLAKIRAGETGTVADMIDDANKQLRERFSVWTQVPPVTVSFDTAGTGLFVHVRSGSGASMKIRERSEGLRQFVALVALTAQRGHRVPPILLIDEIEMHLHYDAQADLIGVLAEQRTASQVIYTTHSAASLPEDLGASVRVVQGIGDKMASTIRQQFWSDDPGLGTLLLAMGAGSLAFVPLRPAAIVEGGADLVLLPSLMKEAIEADILGFQVVPGAAGVPPKRIAGLDLHGVSTAWILDGDQGGRDRRDFLVGEGIPRSRIFLLRSSRGPLDLEDLIHPQAYVRAVNDYAADLGATEEFSADDLPTTPCQRHQVISRWAAAQGIKPPSKTAIANKVLGLRGEIPLVAPRRRAALESVHQKVLAVLKGDE